jgi:hypothetical protein
VLKKSIFLEIAKILGDRIMSRKLRESFVENPDAIFFCEFNRKEFFNTTPDSLARPGVTCYVRSTQREPAPRGSGQRKGTLALHVAHLVVEDRLLLVEL